MTKFEELRKNLYAEVLQWQSDKDMTEEFKKEFFKLIELCTFSMMGTDDNYFALFTMQMKREIKLDLPTAVGSTAALSHFKIYFNPYIFLECSIEEMKALLKHEVYHIMYNHFKRAENIKGKYSNLAISRAMDVSINQYIRSLPSWSDKLLNVGLTYNIDLKPNLTMEQYAEAIQEGIDRLKSKEGKEVIEDKENEGELQIKKKHNQEKAHELWKENEDYFNYEQIKELTKKTASNAAKGKMPNEFKELLDKLNEKPEISWQQYLRRNIGKLPAGYKKTITRKDRRQPERLDIRGRLSRKVTEIVVAIDISGSISDKEIEQILTEVLGIVKNSSSQITIIECDNQIRRVYKAKNKKDIKGKLDTRGGTAFSPVFEYLKKKAMKDCLLIYFTDGVGEEELTSIPMNRNILWVLTGKGEKLSLRRPYGVVKRLSAVEVKAADPTYAKDTMKDILMEWAK